MVGRLKMTADDVSNWAGSRFTATDVDDYRSFTHFTGRIAKLYK